MVTGYLFEGSTEYAQNLVKAGIEAMARGKDFGGVVAAIGEAATQLEDFILGGLMGGVIRGGHDVVQVRGERRRQALQASIAAAAKSEEVTEARAEVEAIVRDNAEAQRRMAFAQSLLQTAEAADSSALHQADPAIFEREAEKLMPEDARSVWLDVDMVREFAGEDNARLEALGLSPRDMADAVQIQAGSVRVPTVRLVSRFQGEDRILLLQSARMTPDGMTLTEARAFDPRKRSEAAAERIRARNRVNAEIGKERTRLKNEFVQAGYAAHVAEYYATMHAEQARAFADRYGSDAAQLLRERSIVRGNAEAAGQARPWQTAFDKSPDSFFSQGAMAADSSLPQRFAEMPGIEADSSQWFGEGKAIALPGKIETPEQRKALRGALKQWAKENFSRDTAVVNADTGWQVQVTPKGIEDSLSHGLDEPLARSVPFIPQIAESGIHVDSIRKTPQLISHLFANKIRLDGKDYVVGFVLREDVNGNRFYDHELTEIIDPDWLAPGHPSSEGPSGEGSSGHRTNRGDVMNILRDRLGVNDGSGQVLFQAASMKPSLPRRFAEMPGIEADSSQWFGEGKAIAADGQNTRKAVVDWARSAFPQGMTIRNADQGWAVQVTPNGIKASLHHGYDDLLARSVPFIPQIVESGIHVASTEKKAGLMSHIFANKIRLDGKDYVVGFVLREDKMGNRFYDHELTEIIDPDWLKPGRDTSAEALGHRTNRGDVMNILRDKLGVNDGSGRVMFQPCSDPSSARGMVQFRADGSSVTSIFAGASDLSTPIHEGAHIFINDLIRVVAGGWRMAEQLFAREFTAVSNDASIDDSLRQRRQRALTQRWNKHKMGLWQAREDLAALVENANAQREAHGKAIGAHLPPVTLEEVVQGTATPEQIRTLQEVNAVSFEGYVREGRAPSSRLAAVFHKMRQWLAAIYRLAGIHGVKVTPEVRRVFDRMLANDEAIRKSAAGTALAGEGEFLSIVQDEEAELVIDESGQWKRKDRINYAPGVVTQETTPGDSGGARSQLVNATAVGIRKPAEAGNGYRKAALNRQSEHERLQELYERAEAHVTARMDKATLRDRNKRWKAYYDEGREMARGDVYYEIVAALTVKEGNPWSGINRAWLEQQYGKAAVADFMKTAQGRRLLNKNGGQTLDAVGVGDIVGNMDRAVAMGIADADGLYNYLYDNVVTRRRSLADDARAWADQRMADDDARAEEAGNDPGEAYRAYLEEVEATVLRLAARQDAGWRTPEQQARWVEEQRTPLTQVRRQVKSILRGRPLTDHLFYI